MKAVNGESVSIGHFKEQGNHSDSGLSYVDLMAISDAGVNGPPRRVLALLWHQNQRLRTSQLVSAMKAWAKDGGSVRATERVLDTYGKTLAKKEMAIFGVAGPMMPANSPKTKKRVGVDGPNSPLVDSGELRDAVRYKTSTGKILKKGG